MVQQQDVAGVTRQGLHVVDLVAKPGVAVLDEDFAVEAARAQDAANEEHGVGDRIAERRAGVELMHGSNRLGGRRQAQRRIGLAHQAARALSTRWRAGARRRREQLARTTGFG